MKIPIKHAIESGAWFHCETVGWGDSVVVFKLRALSFNKIDVRRIDEPHKMKLDEGVPWLLKVEVVNLTKQEIDPQLPRLRVFLFDQDDFEFQSVSDWHLICESAFAKTTGLYRFIHGGDNSYLKPKIKATGAIAYLLPEDDAEYRLSVEGGNIREV